MSTWLLKGWTFWYGFVTGAALPAVSKRRKLKSRFAIWSHELSSPDKMTIDSVSVLNPNDVTMMSRDQNYVALTRLQGRRTAPDESELCCVLIPFVQNQSKMKLVAFRANL